MSAGLLLLIELGFYQYIVKPVYEPFVLYTVYYFNALWPKK